MKYDNFDFDQGPLDEGGSPLLPDWEGLCRSIQNDCDSLTDDPATLDYSRLLETMPRLALESAEFMLSDSELSERRQRLLLEMEVAEYLPEIEIAAKRGIVRAVTEGLISLERLRGLLNSIGAVRGAHAAVSGNDDELLPIAAAETLDTGEPSLKRLGEEVLQSRETPLSLEAPQVRLRPRHGLSEPDRPNNGIITWRRFISYAVAPCLLVVGLAVGYQVAHAAASRSVSALNARVSELLASLDAVKKRPTMDPLQQAKKGREFSIQQGQSPNEAVIRLSPFLGMPYYAGLDVDWGDGSAVESLYFAGPKPESASELRHKYMVAPGGQQLFEIALTYYWSGETMESMKRLGRGGGQKVTERIRLRVSDVGVLPVSGADASIVSASITEPSEDDVIVTEAEPSIRMTLRPPAGDDQPNTQPGGSDRAIQLVVRAMDGPDELRQNSYIQPFTVSVSSLLQEQGEQQFDTWISLPGSGLREPPSKYEILLIELPVTLVQQEIDRRIMNLDDPTVRNEVVRSSRVIRYQPKDDM